MFGRRGSCYERQYGFNIVAGLLLGPRLPSRHLVDARTCRGLIRYGLLIVAEFYYQRGRKLHPLPGSTI